MHRLKVRSQLVLTPSLTMKAKKPPTKRMMAELCNTQMRNQFENIATGHHLVLKMVQFVMTKAFSPGVERTNILRTTSPFIACRGQTGYFSCIPLICSKIVRRCQTSTSTQMLLWLMDQLCRVVSGQVFPGILTHLKLELPHEICLGPSKFALHSSKGLCHPGLSVSK